MITMKLGTALAIGATTGLIGMATGAYLTVDTLAYSDALIAQFSRELINTDPTSDYKVIRKKPVINYSNYSKIYRKA